MARTKVLAYLGGALLIAGVFVPVATRGVRSTTYYRLASDEAMVLIGLGIVSVVVAHLDRFRTLWLTGLGALGLAGYRAFREIVASSPPSNAPAESTTPNAANVAATGLEAARFEWGWAVLIVGAVLIIAAVATYDEGSRWRRS
jgi:hypothetical protein